MSFLLLVSRLLVFSFLYPHMPLHICISDTSLPVRSRCPPSIHPSSVLSHLLPSSASHRLSLPFLRLLHHPLTPINQGRKPRHRSRSTISGGKASDRFLSS
ncbi:hypothetical protein BKA93DRAFT_117114 [Sparassis latifolia]